MGLSINSGNGLTKTDLVNILKANGIKDDAKSTIMFNFDSCDASDETGVGDNELKGSALNKFCKYLENNHPVIYNFLKAFGKNTESSEADMVTLEAPEEHSTESAYAVLNNDRTTTVHMSDGKGGFNTTTYDEYGNVMPAYNEEPVSAPPQQVAESEVPADDKKSVSTLPQQTVVTKAPASSTKSTKTPKEINDEKIAQLKPGEIYTHGQKSVAASDDAFGATAKTVTWKRNDDGTLQMTTLESLGARKVVKLTTKYNADRTQKISEDVPNRDLGLVSTIHYDANGKKKDMTTDLSKLSDKSSYSKPVRIVKAMQTNARSFSSTQVNDSQGNPILIYRNNTWYNAKGKEIDEDKATDIMEKYVNKDNVGELVNTY